MILAYPAPVQRDWPHVFQLLWKRTARFQRRFLWWRRQVGQYSIALCICKGTSSTQHGGYAMRLITFSVAFVMQGATIMANSIFRNRWRNSVWNQSDCSLNWSWGSWQRSQSFSKICLRWKKPRLNWTVPSACQGNGYASWRRNNGAFSDRISPWSWRRRRSEYLG